jgi:integrase
MKLTDVTARSATLPAGKSDVVFWDDKLKGFGLRVRQAKAGVSKNWMIQYRDALGSERRFLIGPLHEVSAAKAREVAADKLHGIRHGAYPHNEREERRQKEAEELARANQTFGVIKKLYLNRQREWLRPKSLEHTTYAMTKLWALFDGVSIHAIDRAMVAQRLIEIATENGGYAANRARSALAAFFNWAIKDGLTTHNPVSATNKPHKEAPRDRVLSDAELAAIWNAAGDDAYGRIVRILMLTGQRRQEIGGMRWDELDLEQGILTVPKERSKTGKPYVVPLVPEVVAMIETMPRMWNTVFGGAQKGFDDFSKSKVKLDARIAELGAPIAEWRLHDLRRTACTAMAEKLNVPVNVVEAILNHVPPGVQKHYHHAVYLAQKREALERWAAFVDAIVTGVDRKVVPLRVA